MIIEITITKEEAKKKVKQYLNGLNRIQKNLSNCYIVVKQNSKTEDFVNYKHDNYEIKLQAQSTLWTGSNIPVCEIKSEYDADVGYMHRLVDIETGYNIDTEKVVKEIIKKTF